MDNSVIICCLTLCLTPIFPEGDFQREETLAAVVAAMTLGQKGGGKVRAEELAKLGQGGDLWQSSHRLFEGGNRRFAEEKGFEALKERGSKGHE